MKVLLSIKPEFANLIFEGSKKFEFRRAMHRDRSISVIAVYATMPVGRIVGEFEVAEILHMTPNALWEQTSEHAGISRDYFDAYFAGRSEAFAIRVAEARLFEHPIDPRETIENFVPPQSFMYLRDDMRRCEGDVRQLALL